MSDFLVRYMRSKGFSLVLKNGVPETIKGRLYAGQFSGPTLHLTYDTDILIFKKGNVQFCAFEYGNSIYYNVADEITHYTSHKHYVSNKYEFVHLPVSYGTRSCTLIPYYCGYRLFLRDSKTLLIHFSFGLDVIGEGYYLWYKPEPSDKIARYSHYLSNPCHVQYTAYFGLLGYCCSNFTYLKGIREILK